MSVRCEVCARAEVGCLHTSRATGYLAGIYPLVQRCKQAVIRRLSPQRRCRGAVLIYAISTPGRYPLEERVPISPSFSRGLGGGTEKQALVNLTRARGKEEKGERMLLALPLRNTHSASRMFPHPTTKETLMRKSMCRHAIRLCPQPAHLSWGNGRSRRGRRT